jgi:hypothetical protein
MTEVAHKPDCDCPPCQSPRPAEYTAVAARDWEADATEAGKVHRQTGKNLWHVAYLVAVNVEPGTGQGKRTDKATSGHDVQKSGQVSFAAFADVAKLDRRTISKYYDTWQAAAKAGLVPEASTLGRVEPKKILAKLSTDDWSDNYPKRELPAPVSSSSGSKKPGSPAHSVARDQALPVDNASPGKATTSRNPGKAADKPAEAEITGQVVDAPLLRHAKEALVAARNIQDYLKADSLLDGPVMTVLADLFNAVSDIEKLTAVKLNRRGT